MPLSRKEFERGKRYSLEDYLLELFKEYVDVALCMEDLKEILNEQGIRFSEEELKELLTLFIRQKKIQYKEIGGERFYIHFKRPLGFRKE